MCTINGVGVGTVMGEEGVRQTAQPNKKIMLGELVQLFHWCTISGMGSDVLQGQRFYGIQLLWESRTGSRPLLYAGTEEAGTWACEEHGCTKGLRT